MLLQGKVALVVGVNDDLGSTTAEMMAKEGAKVAIAERNHVKGKALLDKISACGGEAIYQEIDITFNRSQKAAISRTISEYGRLDIAFNNVSVDGDRLPLAKQLEEMVAGVVDINFCGTWLSLKHQIGQMLKNGGGAIVNNVSEFQVNGTEGCSVYRATKSAITAMSQAAAMEYAGENIRINTISPGLLKRSHYDLESDREHCESPNMIPMNRYATPQEIAEAIVWLCSDKASYITGQNLSIDGGLTSSR